MFIVVINCRELESMGINLHLLKNKWFLVISLIAFPAVYYITFFGIQIIVVGLLAGIYGYAVAQIFSKKSVTTSYNKFVILIFTVIGIAWNFYFDNPMAK